ncbi:MAG: tetratricopeptide repeat protein [Bacteroidales bacterium]
MSKNTISHGDENLEKIGDTLNTAENFVLKYQNHLLYGIIGIAFFIIAIFGYKNWYLAPLEEEAQAQLFSAVQYFEQDSLNIALNGDGTNLGLIEVIEQYGITQTANLAQYYAGLCYLHLGQYEEAVEYLKKYSPKDKLAKAIAYGNLGDAYSELKMYRKAVSSYKKAVSADDSHLTAPRFLQKAGLVLEAESNYKEALKLYEKIKQNYPTTPEGRDADKYITRAQVLMEQN